MPPTAPPTVLPAWSSSAPSAPPGVLGNAGSSSPTAPPVVLGGVGAVVAAVAAFRAIEMTTNAANNDTITIASADGGVIVYTFKTAPTAAYQVQIGAGIAATRDNLVNAIKATGTYLGDPNPQVTAGGGSGGTLVLTAKATGESGNEIEVYVSASAKWGGFSSGNLSGGVDGTGVRVMGEVLPPATRIPPPAPPSVL